MSDPDTDLLQLHGLELLCVFCFITLLVLGATNRVVVCRDLRDLRWTMSPAPIVLISFICGEFLVREMSPVDAVPILIRSLEAGAALALLALVPPLIWSVRANGILLGPVIFVFKVIACPLLAVLSVFAFEASLPVRDYVDENGRLFAGRGVSVNRLLGGLGLGWLLGQLVNGDEVAHRRLTKLLEQLPQDRARRPIDLTPKPHPPKQLQRIK